jgi:hypothetical protein
MKKIIFLFCLTASAYAERKIIPTTIEARFSYFWPESKTLREIYHNGGINYQLTGTIPFYQGDNFGLRGLNFWWALDYFLANGKSIGLEEKTRLQIEPLTAGLKWITPNSIVRPYFGAGFKYYFMQIRNYSSFVKQYMANNGSGFVLDTGVQLFIAKHLLADLFASYSFKQFGALSIELANVEATWLDIGGLNFGGGIGVKF